MDQRATGVVLLEPQFAVFARLPEELVLGREIGQRVHLGVRHLDPHQLVERPSFPILGVSFHFMGAEGALSLAVPAITRPRRKTHMG